MNNVGRTWRHEQGEDGCKNCGIDEHSHVWKCECGRELAWKDKLLPINCVCGSNQAMLWCPGNQSRVSTWVRKVFSEKETTDVPERALRMAEEALELAQACEVDAATLHRLVDYVMSRPVGKPAQEIAGTMVTVYALAGALGVDADTAFEVELERIQQPEVIERCQMRQHEKRAALEPKQVQAHDGGGTWFELQKTKTEAPATPDDFCDDGKTGALR